MASNGDPSSGRSPERRAELLRHAEEMFVARGYGETRMVDVARAAGVSKSLVYWYFGAKDELFREVVIDAGQRLRSAQQTAVLGIDDPLERLYMRTVVSVRFMVEHHRLYGLIVSQLPVDQRLRAAHRQSRRMFADDLTGLLAEGQDRGTVRLDEDAAVLAHACTGAVAGLVLHHCGESGEVDPAASGDDEVAHTAARCVVRTVAAEGAVADAVVASRGSRVSGGGVVGAVG